MFVNNYIENSIIIKSTFENKFDEIVHNGIDKKGVIIGYQMCVDLSTKKFCMDEKGNAYIDIPFCFTESDIVSNFHLPQYVETTMGLVVNGKIRKFLPNEIFMCALLFSRVELRIYFLDTTINLKKLRFSYDAFIFSNIEERTYYQRNEFETNFYVYRNGKLFDK